MALDPNIQLQVGDLVDATFHGARNWGVIVEISDGCERNMPGELMYKTDLYGRDVMPAVWLHRWEIFAVLDPEEAMKEVVQDYTKKVESYYERTLGHRRAIWNQMVKKIVIERGTKIFHGWL